MEVAELKTDLHKRIDQADEQQTIQIYGLMLNYFNSLYDIEEWAVMPEFLKEKITKGLKEAKAGLGSPLEEVMIRVKEKYGLDG